MRHLVLVAFFVSFAAVFPCQATEGFDLGISVGEEGLRSFYLAVGDYYRVPEGQVVRLKKLGLPDEEMPVALFLARRAGVEASVVVGLRLEGKSWMDITLRYGLTPEIFYVPVKTGPPYGKAYGHYMGMPKGQWKKLRLKDEEVVNLVNLRFISEHYGISPAEIIKMRENGETFVNMHGKAKKTTKSSGASNRKRKAKKNR